MALIGKPKIKSIPYEEFKDNESLEKMIDELNANGANVLVTTAEQQSVADELRYQLLCHRADGHGRSAL